MGPRRAINAGKAFVTVGLDRSALEAGLRRLGTRINRFGRNLARNGAGLAGFGTAVTAAVAGPVALATQRFAEFDDQARFLAGVLGTTQDNIRGLVQQAEDLGRTTAFTAVQVGQLQVELAKLGFNEEQISNASAAILNLGSVTREELGDVARVTGSVLRAFNLDAAETTRVTDVLAAGFSNSALDLTKLETAFNAVGPVAANLGFSLEETVAILGRLVNSGLDASTAGTSLRSIFLQLADPASDLSKRLGENINSVDELIPALQRLVDSGVDVGEALELTDKRAVTAFLTLANGAEDVAKLNDVLLNSGGFAARAALEIEGGIGGAFRRFQSAVEGAALSLARAFAPTIVRVTEFINRAIEPITKFVAENQKLIQTIGLGVAGLGSAFVVLGTSAVGIGGLLSGIGFALGGIATVVSTLATPMGAVALAIGAVGFQAFRSSGGIEKLARLFQDDLPEAMQAAVGFIDQGELEKAFQVVFLTIRISLQETLADMLEQLRRWFAVASTLGFGGGVLADAIDQFTDNPFERDLRGLRNRRAGLLATGNRQTQRQREEDSEAIRDRAIARRQEEDRIERERQAEAQRKAQEAAQRQREELVEQQRRAALEQIRRNRQFREIQQRITRGRLTGQAVKLSPEERKLYEAMINEQRQQREQWRNLGVI